MTGKRFLISGTVQGVSFRASTRAVATRLGLVGHALNLPDGRVEVVAHGSDEALDQLGQWLQHGPERARDERVEVETIEAPAPDRFLIG